MHGSNFVGIVSLSVKRRIGLGMLVFGALMCGCSTTATSTSTTARGSLNATPCNYARAWSDNPTQFSEFGPLARYARMADSAKLQAEGRQLATAVASDDTDAISEAAGTILSTCQGLHLVPTRVATSTTG
jgi:hypothetical protein